jgi:hypothetical protein
MQPNDFSPFDDDLPQGDGLTPTRPFPASAWSDSSEDDTAHSHTSRARERQAKRRQHVKTTKKSMRSQPQIARPDRFQMPNIRLSVNRTLFVIIGAVLVIGLVVYFLGRLRNNPTESYPNAIWIGTEWTYEQPSETEVQALAQRLRQSEIGTVYAWVSWLQADETWRGEANFPNVQTFVQQFRRAYPEAQLYGWVSLPVEDSDIPYRLDDPAIRQKVAEFSSRVVNEFGFDGVFLNVEPVWNDDQNFLALLREVRNSVGIDTPIGTAVPPDWSPLGADIPVPAQIVPGTAWDKPYKQSVALLVNELALMTYNSGLGAPSDYETWMAYQVATYAEAISELGEGTEIVIGIPTYDAEPPGHDPYVENVYTAIAGLKAGLTAAGENADFVRGVAIYADWTTDDAEWQAFQEAWVRP